MGKPSKAAGGSSTKKKQQRVVTTRSGGGKRGRAPALDDNEGNSNIMFSKKKKGNASSSAADSAIAPLSAENAVLEMFKLIAEDPTDPNSQADIDGITILGEKLEMDAAEDIRILVLLWKLGVGKPPAPTPSEPVPTRGYSSSSRGGSSSSSASKPTTTPSTSTVSRNFVPGTIQASEWIYGCQQLHVDSWESLAALKPTLDLGFLDSSEFRDFYRFCFRFNLNGTHKSLDNETAVALIQMIFGSDGCSGRVDSERIESFVQFLEDAEKAKIYSKITLDQWMSFYDFCQEIRSNDVLLKSSAYDESTSAWPVLIDDYVDFVQSKK